MDDKKKTKAELIAELEELRAEKTDDNSVTVNAEEFLMNSILLDNLPHIALVLKKETREIVASNKAAREIGAVPGETCFRICADRDDPCPFCLAPVLWSDEKPNHVEVEYRGKYYEGIWVPFSEELYVHYIIDITERKKTEMNLQKTQNLLAETEIIGKVGGWEVDIDTKKSKWSAGVCHIHEVELTLNPTVDEGVNYYTPKSRRIISQAVQSAIEEGKSFDLELEIITAKGNLRTVHTIGKPDLEHRRVYGFFQDITDRKKVVEELEEFFNMENYMMCIADLKGNFIKVSDTFETTLGYTPEELISQPYINFVHPEDKETTVNLIKNELSSGVKILIFENRYRCKDGTYKWLSWTGHPDVNTGVSYSIAFDITDRKEAETKLHLLAGMLDEAPNSITIHNYDGNFLFANKKTFDIHGYTEHEFMSLSLQNLDVPESKELIDERLRLIAEKGEASFESAHFRKDMSTVPMEVFAKKVDWNGLPAILSIATDITERKKTEKMLFESRERYRLVNESSYDFIYSYDINGAFTFGNQSFCDAIGQKPKELIGKKHVDLGFPEEKVIEWEKMLRQVIETNDTFKGESTVQLPDGQTHQYDITLNPIQDSSGNIVGISGITRDITERKKAEIELRESEEKFSAIFSSMAEIAVLHELVFDKKGKPLNYRIIDCNRAYSEELGIARDDAIGRLATEVYGTEEPPYFDEYSQVALTGIPYIFESYFPPMQKHFSISVVAPGKNQFLTITSDISDRKKAEEKIIRNEARLESLLRLNTYHSDNIQEFLDFALNEIIELTGSKIGYIYFYDEETEEFTLNTWSKDVMKDCKVLQPQTKYQLDKTGLWGEAVRQRCPIMENSFASPNQLKKGIPHGHVVLEKFLTIPVFDKHHIVAVVGVANKAKDYTNSDIRQMSLMMDAVWKIVNWEKGRKQLEEEHLKSSKLESIGLLAGGIAHDFNNILSVILGNTSLAKIGLDNKKEAEELLTEVEKASVRAKKLTQQLLTFAKGGAPVKEVTELSELIKETTKFSLRGSNVQYSTSIPPDLWTAEVDKGQISQVIGNLVINAQQAMPEGGTINIKAENVTVTPENNLPLQKGNYIKISLEDKGLGISPEQLTMIFDPYFTTKQKGSGLGLATTYSIINRHDGHINVDSKLGFGTTFLIYLPASSKQIVEEETGKENSIVLTGKILVMDDDDSLRKFVLMALKSFGNDVDGACDGAEAIGKYKNAMDSDTPFDAVIMDLTIPGGMGGQEAIKKLLEIDPDAKAIVSSGYADDPVVSNFEAYGFKGNVSKPFRLDELKKVLTEVLSGK